MLMMLPPPREHAGSSARVRRYIARTLRSNANYHSSSVQSRIVPWWTKPGAVEQHVYRARPRPRTPGSPQHRSRRAGDGCTPRPRRASPRRYRWRSTSAPSRDEQLGRCRPIPFAAAVTTARLPASLPAMELPPVRWRAAMRGDRVVRPSDVPGGSAESRRASRASPRPAGGFRPRPAVRPAHGR